MEEINFKRLAEITMSLKWIIVGMLILMLGIGCLYSFGYVVPKYDSTIKLVLAQNSSDVTNASMSQDTITQADLSINNQLVSTYSEIIKSKKIVKKVIDQLALSMDEDSLARSISVSSIKDTQVLQIVVINENAELAKNIAKQIAIVFMEEVKSLYNISNVNIIDEAEISETPCNINHVKDIIVFEILGILLSGGMVLIVYLIDTTIKDEKDVETELKLHSLGQIPLYKEENEGEKKELLSFEDSKSPITECFRTLRTNLVFAKNNTNLKNILIISSFSSEGKSYVASNLAMSFAKTDKKVVIIDADMRKGRQHRIFNIKNTRGLSNCLANVEKFDSSTINQVSKYVKTTEYPNVHLMTSGTRPANPLELISSEKMIELISLLDKIYDYVIIDGTPTNIVSDSVALSKCVDATVMICEYKKTKIEAINRVKRSIENVGGNITGVIINKCPISEKNYTDTYYYAESISEEEEESDTTTKQNLQKEPPKVQSFKELVSEIDLDNEEDGILEEKENIKPSAIVKTNTEKDYNDHKLDLISDDISSMKTLFMEYITTNDKKDKEDYKKEIEELREQIKELKSKLK